MNYLDKTDDELQTLLINARIDLQDAKSLVDVIEEAILNKHKESIKEQLAVTDDHTGTVKIGTVKITYPKRVMWDQSKLGNLYREIGEDAFEYIDVKYSVKEGAYKSWPTAIRAEFEPARTVMSGKPVISFAEAK